IPLTRLATLACSSPGNAANHGSTILKQMDVQERSEGSSARKSTQSVSSTQAATASRLEPLRSFKTSNPPRSSAQRRPSKASSTQSIEGVFIVAVSYTHLRAHETKANLVCRLLLEKKKKNQTKFLLIRIALVNQHTTSHQ